MKHTDNKISDISTDKVRSRRRRTELILVLTTLAVWGLAAAVFWLFTTGSDGMGYSLIFIWGILPVTTFVVSLIAGKDNCFGKGKFAVPALFGILYPLAGYVTFDVANMTAFKTVRWPDLGMILPGVLISALGLAAGIFVNKRKAKQNGN